MKFSKYIPQINQILKDNNLTISVAESTTSGLLQNKMASINDSSQLYKGGVTTCTIEEKVNILGVSKDDTEEQITIEMAKGSQHLFVSDISIAITSHAETGRLFYYCIAIGDSLIDCQTISCPIFLTQNEYHEYCCELVLERLVSKLFSLYPTKEIEYKFKPSSTFSLDAIKSLFEKEENIQQCYLVGSKKLTSRIRLINNTKAFSTTKLPKNIEVEFQIPYPEAKYIFDSFGDDGLGTINKTRYTIPWNGLKIEVDVFHGRHDGLIVIEIEVPDINYKLPALPTWISKQQLSISNAELANR